MTGRASLLIGIGLAVVPAAVQAQTDLPAGVALRVDSVFAAFDGDDAPGCALGIYRGASLSYARGYGMADLEHRVPIGAHTIFDLGSTSKQFTATAVALLAQDGVLTLDDDVRRWIPELPEYERPITIRHLLNHTSGLRDYIGLLSLAGARYDDVTTAADALAAIVRQRELNFLPGDEFLYSNSGFFLLSEIVQRASGQTLRDFARARIFDPLAMHRTHFLGSYDDIVRDRASAYSPRRDGYRLDMPRWLQTGDGAVFTSVEELLAWHRNYLEPRLGGAPLVDALHTRGVLTSGDTLTYALGLRIGSYRGLQDVSHGGAWGGYRAEFARFPGAQTSIAVLCNVGNANASLLARRVADIVLGDVLAPVAAPAAASAAASPAAPPAPPAVELSPSQQAALAGAYHSRELDVTYRLEAEADRIILSPERRPDMRLTLRPLSADEFAAGAQRLRVVRDETGAATAFVLDLGRIRNFRFERTVR
jgi:CubicO group peptidase (beta-lactamase class C family)